jgi:hypothetical protein
VWGALSDRGTRGVVPAGGALRGLGLVAPSQVADGGVMPLYPLLTREYFGEKVMGAAYGGAFLVSTLGVGPRSLAGGLIYDHPGSYARLYTGSAAIGVAGGLPAFGFRPPRAITASAAARAPLS